MKQTASPFEIKNLSDSGQIEGILAGFGNVDFGGDKLVAGCLSKSLASRSTPLPMLLHHDMRRPIGAWKEWTETRDGLFVKGTLTLSARDGQEAHALAKDGALTGLSIGWNPTKSHNEASGARIVTEADIHEGSLVTVPMNPKAQVTSIKSIVTARDIAEILQDAGLSSRKAKAAAGAAWKAINQSDDDEQADAALAAILTAANARLAS